MSKNHTGAIDASDFNILDYKHQCLLQDNIDKFTETNDLLII